MGYSIETITPGKGRQISNGDQVTVRMQMKTEKQNSAAVYWYTSIFHVGKGKVFPGLDKALLKMRQGQEAEIRMTPDYGYGATGCPSLNIPPDSKLIVRIRVIKVKRAKYDPINIDWIISLQDPILRTRNYFCNTSYPDSSADRVKKWQA